MARFDDPVTERVRSLEVRWIFPGQAASVVTGWFGRFRPEVESRDDTYLASPQLRGLSVKVRGGRALEVKVYQGSPGILDVASRARGRMESWHKWSFPCRPLSQGATAAGWTPVHKRISWISLANGQIQIRRYRPDGEPACKLELTEIHARGQPWWTLGLEATGPASVLRQELAGAAGLLAAPGLPAGIELDAAHAMSYAEWMRRWLGLVPEHAERHDA